MQNYISALFSNIAYIKTEDYTLKSDGTLEIFDIKKSGITQEELNFFNDNFKIKDQRNGTEGFSVMKIVAVNSSGFGGFSAGDITIAYRGTEINNDDLVTDAQMALLAISQLATNTMSNSEELNKLLVAINKFGANDFDLWSDSVKSQLSQATDYFNEQKLLNNNLNVVGHSLGGYLANSVTITGDNYNSINNTTTFNAPGFNMGTIAIIEIKKAINDLINTDTTNLSPIEIHDLVYELNKLSTKLGSSTFDEESLKKLHTLYSSAGINFTSNETIMFSPVPKIPVYTTPQIDPTATHGIGFLQESTALYDILNSIMKGSSVENYKKITEILDNYQKTTSSTTLSELTLHISKYLGIENNNTANLFNHVFNMTNEQFNTLNYDELNYSNYSKSSAYVYALMNLVPIVISNEIDIFQNTIYDITKYSKESLLNRFILFERYSHLNTIENFITKTVTIPTMNIHENYKLIYDYNENIDLYTFIDEKNKIIMTNDFTSYINLTNDEFNFSGDLTNNIKTTYFKNNKSTLFVNTLNNIVYDTTLDDYIALNKGSTNLDLSYGSDTINIEVSNGAKINNLTIKDGGIGDLFIFNGGQLDDYIIGTQYNDNIIGNNGNDTLNGLNGDDKLYGGNGNDSLIGGGGSNYLEGGDGDDTLNDHGSMYEYNDVRGDTLNAGKGINTIYGTGYGDTYLYSKQDGYTTIHENNTNSGFNYIDKLVFDSTIQGIEVSLFKNLYELIIAINGIKKIFIIDYFNNYNYLEEIHFTDVHNTTWYTDDILSRYTDLDEKLLAGSSADDNLQGGDDNEDLDGRDGNDIIRGGKGNDVIYGGDGNDTIYGDAGNDTLNGNEGDDIIYGGDGVDIINGDNGDDKLYGDAGEDFIYGGDGIDTIYGGLDNDFINGNNGDDKLNGDAGNDTIFGGGGNDTISGGTGNDKIYGDDGDDKISSGSTGTNETDKLYGGNGIDTISNAINNTYIRGGNDDDKIFTSGNNVDIDGENGNDIIYMSTGSGSLKGGDGDDTFINNGNPSSTYYTIEGGSGDDTINMTRGHHNIIYRQGDGNDKIIINGTNATSQTDSIRIHGYSKNSITSENLFLLDNNKSLKLQLSGDDSINLVNFLTSTTSINNLNSFQFDDGMLTSQDLITLISNIKGTNANDRIYDTPFNDTIDMSETGGQDYVYLKSGFDTLYTGIESTTIEIASSNNIVHSGSGNDYLTLNSHYSNVLNLKDSNNGHDQINLSIFATGSKITANIHSTINISNMYSYFFTFSWENNSSLTFDKKFLNNQITFNGEQLNLDNIDLVGDSSDNYLKALTDRDQYIRGNGGVDQLYGGNGRDHIFGGTGNDKLYGEGGNDVIYGEEGNDTIVDMSGNNTIWGGDDDDTITTGDGTDTIHGGNGNDTINSGIGPDIIYGGSGDDKIYGNGGFYYGEGGNDTYGVSNGHIVDNSGYNTLNFGTDYRDNVTIDKTGTGFNISVSGKNGVNNITYVGEISRIEQSYMLPDGYTYKNSLVSLNLSSGVNEINRLFELQASLVNETDEIKITQMRTEISNLWGYDKP